MRFLLTIQYLGTRYAGWQSQENAVGVQQVIEAIVEKMFGSKIALVSAGRTDSGVHARGQRAHLDIAKPIRPRGLILGLNDQLPRDIRILDAVMVDESFHARFDAKSKTYAYRILSSAIDDVFLMETHANVRQPLDIERMREAASALVGEHDFRAFTVRTPEVSSTVRTVRRVDISTIDQRIHIISITADGFLRYMVRRIAGSLIEIGRGKLDPAAISRSLHPSFEQARWTAPAHGLTLENVEYETVPALPEAQESLC